MAFVVVTSGFAFDKNPKPLAKKVIQLGEYKLIVEIADKHDDQMRGLMFRKSLNENHGMLFVFETNEILIFWMKNTYIPLDIGFFDENKMLIEYHTMIPLSLKLISSSKKAKYALELRKNWFKDHNIKAGTKLIF